jgi:uncharacterized membrane protein
MPNNKTTQTTFFSSLIIGVLAIGLAFYAAFILEVKSPLQWIFVVLLLLTGIVCLSMLFTGNIIYKEKYLSATRGFALFFVLMSFVLYAISPPAEDISLKIQFKNQEGTTVLNDAKNALKISISKDTKTYDINGDGEVLINIASTTKLMDLELLEEDWQFQSNKKKSLQTGIGKDGVVQLMVEPSESRCCITGKVSFEDKKQRNLAGVIVKVGVKSTITDAQGNYSITLPANKRLENMLLVEAYKDQYQGSIHSNTAAPSDIILRKK